MKLNVEVVERDLPSPNAGGRGCSVTEDAICENVGQDCGNGTTTLDSTEKTIEGKKKMNWIWTEKTGFSLEKVEQIMDFPSWRRIVGYSAEPYRLMLAGWFHMVGGCEEANRSIMDWCAFSPHKNRMRFRQGWIFGETKGTAHVL
ncbi:hypothetical protein AVEN_12315-1 [Araneus ventricosus]|uniref:Uncharacterized protein n=1 Tax=Araneus ventricosus TaxID=182803 RepID=A0A4Y2E8D6_ARAVE|nr:hypothetical protein AVEN_12315-1 [Araneus ventricosus]